MLALQRGAVWAEERLLGALRQPVPQNGRVHLHIIEEIHANDEKNGNLQPTPKSRNTKTRPFSKSSRELFPSSLCPESGTQRNC